jgi:AcrR family transcriptional regulator
MKRKTSREILAESFKELAQTMPVNKITVQKIADNCGYSPATFYRQFRDKYDLIAWDYTRGPGRILEQLDEKGVGLEATTERICSYYLEQQEYVRNLLAHTGGRDSFVRYMAHEHAKMMEGEVRRLCGDGAIDEVVAFCIRSYCLGTTAVVCEWIEGGCKLPTKRLARLCMEALPAPLARLLNI